jgi:adenosylcobinamide kinase/adenosylcobinamide-phosphate guanylyltransferase
MGKVILITGACRSGKSTFALRLAERDYGRRMYLATAEALDDEMRERIKEHRKKRGGAWRTVEEPVEIAKVLKECGDDADVIVLDCVTLWISNLMMKNLESDRILSLVDELLDVVTDISSDVVFVTNEVGWGIVPDNRLARDFRDSAGAVNQKIAHAADAVVLLVSGIPLTIKGKINVDDY